MNFKAAAAPIAFTLLILAIFLTAFWSSRAWPVQARFFPSAICIPGLLLCLAQIVADLWRARTGTTAQSGPIMDLAVDRTVPAAVALRRAAKTWGWIAGFFGGTWLLGFVVSTPLFIWSYLTFQSGERWWVALAATASVLFFLLVVFQFILHVPWIPGVIPGPQETILRWIGNFNLV